ncbi:MAG: type III pantothenate kinase [Cyanobacteria bacterium REEB65]|nr:type III pantothenate kinase [Cyanobacteria bacterium REEB65]
MASVVVAGNTWTTLTRFAPGPEPVGSVRTTQLEACAPNLAAWEASSPVDLVISVVPPRDALLAASFPNAVFLSHRAFPLAIAYADPAALGSDRLANALAAHARYGSPVLVVDCGTATTFTLVDERGSVAGGAIAIGLATARDALAEKTSRLPAVDLALLPLAPATDTQTALQLGLVHGQAGMIRHLCQQLAPRAPMVLTGGWSSLLAPLLPEGTVDPHLTATGGRIYLELLKGESLPC